MVEKYKIVAHVGRNKCTWYRANEAASKKLVNSVRIYGFETRPRGNTVQVFPAHRVDLIEVTRLVKK